MNANAYQVVLSGDLSEGATIEDVSRRMAKLFKTAEPKIAALLNRKNSILKRNIDMQTAGKYQRAIENTGAICRVEPMAKPAAPVAARHTEIAPAETAALSTGPNVVPVQMLYRGEERFCPEDINKLTGIPNGFNFNLPDVSDVPFNRVSAISAFIMVENGKESVRLLLFISTRERPFICQIDDIALPDFPIQALANPLATFRGFLHWLCRQHPAMILEESTFDFLSGSTLPKLDNLKIQKLSTAIGKLIEAGEAE